MSKTNHLQSHYPERRSYPANKMIPKGVLRKFRKVYRLEVNGKTLKFGGSSRSINFFKKFHNKKSRMFNRNINNFLD